MLCRRCLKRHPDGQPPAVFIDEIKPTVLYWGDKKEWWIDLCGRCERDLMIAMDRCLNARRDVVASLGRSP